MITRVRSNEILHRPTPGGFRPRSPPVGLAFGHHANRRRKADKQARDSRDLTGCTEGDIDDHFGWDQKARKKKSQLHYRGRLERIKRARTTMYL